MRMSNAMALVVLGGAALPTAGQGVAQGYRLVELSPPSGSTVTHVNAINNRGQSVGSRLSPSGDRPVIWDSAGAGTNLGLVPDVDSATAIDINDEGSVLVQAFGSAGGTYVYTFDGERLDLPAPPGLTSVSRGSSMNAQGEVAGEGFDPIEENPVGIVWERTPAGMSPVIVVTGDILDSFESPIVTDSGLFITGGTSGTGFSGTLMDRRTGSVSGGLGSSDSLPLYDANDSRSAIVIEYSGSSSIPGEPRLVSLSGPDYTLEAINCDQPNADCGIFYVKLDLDDVVPLIPLAMNEWNVVVGSSDVVLLDSNGVAFDREEDRSAFAWSAETGTIELATLVQDGSDDGWALTSAVDVNEAGWIVGNGTKDGQPRAFLLIPREPCAGDTNRDGQVTPADFSAWISAFNAGCD